MKTCSCIGRHLRGGPRGPRVSSLKPLLPPGHFPAPSRLPRPLHWDPWCGWRRRAHACTFEPRCAVHLHVPPWPCRAIAVRSDTLDRTAPCMHTHRALARGLASRYLACVPFRPPYLLVPASLCPVGLAPCPQVLAAPDCVLAVLLMEESLGCRFGDAYMRLGLPPLPDGAEGADGVEGEEGEGGGGPGSGIDGALAALGPVLGRLLQGFASGGW